MLTMFRFVLSLHIPLSLTELYCPAAHPYLPLGGNHISQLGILLGVTMFVYDAKDIFPKGKPHNKDEDDEASNDDDKE